MAKQTRQNTEWTIPVDRDGNRLDKKPLFGGRWARPAIDVKIYPPIEELNSLAERTEAHFKDRWDYLEESHYDHMNQAVFLLSQSDTGRSLLSHLKEHNIPLIIDTKYCENIEARGACLHNSENDSTKIVLRHDLPVENMALLIAHEARHAVQHSLGLREEPDDLTRETLTKRQAMEADCRAFEALVAKELKYGSPDGPRKQFCSGEFEEAFRALNPVEARASDIHQAYARTGQQEKFLAKTFDAYYDSHTASDYYEKTEVENYANDVAKVDYESQKGVKQKGLDLNRYRSLLLSGNGLPYLESQARQIDFNDPRYSGLHDKSHFKETRRILKDFAKDNPELLNDPGLAIPRYKGGLRKMFLNKAAMGLSRDFVTKPTLTALLSSGYVVCAQAAHELGIAVGKVKDMLDKRTDHKTPEQRAFHMAASPETVYAEKTNVENERPLARTSQGNDARPPSAGSSL